MLHLNPLEDTMRTLPLSLLLALGACTTAADDVDDTDDTDVSETDTDETDDTDDTNGDEALVGCVAVTTEVLTDLDAVPDGFGAASSALLAAVTGTFAGDLARAPGGTLAVTLGLTRTGDVKLERREWVDATPGDDGGIEPALGEDCPDVLRFDAAATLVAGTALDEAFTADVTVDTEGRGALFAGIGFDALVGDAVPDGFDPSTMAQVALQVSAQHDGLATWTLDVGFFGESFPSGVGDDATVSATNDPYAEGPLTRPAE